MRRFLLGLFLLVATTLSAHAVEVDLQWPKGTQFFDDAGSVLDSGTINIYDAGTTDLRTTYSDSGGEVANTLNGSNQIVLGSDGRLTESVYIPTGSWKFVVKDSGGTTLVTEDSIEGALDTSSFVTGTAAWSLPVLSKTSDYSVATSDLGKCINTNTTSGDVTLTLPSAATAGDGKTLCVKHNGSANQTIIATVSSQTIDGHDTFVLDKQYATALIYADGANWHIAAQATQPGSIVFTVADILTAPPASPEAGAWYIITGTPTGDWASYSEEDIVRAAGDGGWHRFTPPTDSGWLAYDQDSNTLYQFRASAWTALSNITAPTASDLGYAVYNDQKASGTAGGAAGTNDTWNDRTLNTEVSDTIGCSVSSNAITCPAGSYLVFFADTHFQANDVQIRFASTSTTSTVTAINSHPGSSSDVATTVAGFGFVEWADSEEFKLQYNRGSTSGGSSNALGQAASTGHVEVYANVTIFDLESVQGPQGAQGAQGATGDAGLTGVQMQFDTDVDMASDADSGDVRFSSSTVSEVTQISIDDADENSADISTWVLTWDDAGSTVRGHVTVQSNGTPSTFGTFVIDGASTDNSGWTVLSVSHIDSSGTFSEDEDVSVSFSRTGDVGATGATGSQGIAGPTVSLTWAYDSGVAGTDPGSGNFAFSSETLSSVTRAYFDDESTSGGAVDVGAWIATFDDFGTASNRGQLIFIDASDSTAFAIYDVTAVSDSTGYWTVSLSHVASNGTFAGEVAAYMSHRGDTGSGDVSGPGSSTDNALSRWDGTGGDTLQDSGWLLDDGDSLTAASGLIMGGNEVYLDADGDTTVTADSDDQIDIRIGDADDFQFTANTFTALSGSTINTADANAVTENSVSISPIGQQPVFWPAPALLSRSTNGCASGSTEAGTNDVNVSTFDCDPATNEAVQTPMFQMPKSWDEGTVVFEVVWLSSATTANVVFGVSGQCFTDSDLLDSSFGTQVTAQDAGLNAVDVAETGEIGPVTLSNAGEEYSCVVELERIADDVGDGLLADVSILGLRMHYTTDAAKDD